MPLPVPHHIVGSKVPSLPLSLLPSLLLSSHPTSSTLNLDPCTLRPTPGNRDPTPYTLHPTPYTIHHTPYSSLRTLNGRPEAVCRCLFPATSSYPRCHP